MCGCNHLLLGLVGDVPPYSLLWQHICELLLDLCSMCVNPILKSILSMEWSHVDIFYMSPRSNIDSMKVNKIAYGLKKWWLDQPTLMNDI